MGTPIVGDLGTAFSIRPATGTVEAFSSLDCEVVFHPSFSAPEDGEFSLQVVGAGASPAAASQLQQLQQHLVAPLKLRCVARNGPIPQRWIVTEMEERKRIRAEKKEMSRERKEKEKAEKEREKKDREREKKEKDRQKREKERE